jgi:hypothetical protein
VDQSSMGINFPGQGNLRLHNISLSPTIKQRAKGKRNTPNTNAPKSIGQLCFPFEKHLGILAVFAAVQCIPQDSICIDSGIHPL